MKKIISIQTTTWGLPDRMRPQNKNLHYNCPWISVLVREPVLAHIWGDFSLSSLKSCPSFSCHFCSPPWTGSWWHHSWEPFTRCIPIFFGNFEYNPMPGKVSQGTSSLHSKIKLPFLSFFLVRARLGTSPSWEHPHFGILWSGDEFSFPRSRVEDVPFLPSPSKEFSCPGMWYHPSNSHTHGWMDLSTLRQGKHHRHKEKHCREIK